MELIGEAKFNEEFEIVKKLVEQEAKKGEFKSIEGAVDSRDKSFHDVELSSGYKMECGIKGGKLSGGQK